MIGKTALRDTISVYTESASGTSDYGDPIMVESAPVVHQARVSPNASAQFDELRDTRIQTYSVIVDGDATLTGLHRIVWRNKSLVVVGEPREFTGRDGGIHHYEFEVEEILG